MTPTTMTPTTMTTMSSERATHAEWVDLWRETALIACSGYPDPLTDEQRAAYLTLPDLIARCKEAWLAIPELERPVHYLSAY